MLRGVSELLLIPDRLLAIASAPAAAGGSAVVRNHLPAPTVRCLRALSAPTDVQSTEAVRGARLHGTAPFPGTVSTASGPITLPDGGAGSPAGAQPSLWPLRESWIHASRFTQPHAPFPTSGRTGQLQ